MNEIGLVNGDKIISVNDQPLTYFEELNTAMLLGEKMTIERDGVSKDLVIPINFIEKIVEKGKRSILLMPRIPAIVGELRSESVAAKNGLMVKDQIIGIDSTEIMFFDQVKPLVKNRAGDSILLHVRRDGQEIV